MTEPVTSSPSPLCDFVKEKNGDFKSAPRTAFPQGPALVGLMRCTWEKKRGTNMGSCLQDKISTPMLHSASQI